MIHIAICDDEPIFLESFQNKLGKQFKKSDIGYEIKCYSNGKEFLKEITKFDAVFLDIDMPEMSGMEIAAYVNQNYPMPILFLTAHDELVYSSIQFQPFRFIRKDHIDSELEEAVCALDEHILIQFQKHSVCLHTSTGDMAMSVKDIKYVEIYGHCIKIHTKAGTFDCYGSLTDYEKRWEKYGFIRTHKSYLVNVWYIYSILKDTIILDSGEEVMLSRRKASEVMKKFEVIMRSI